MSTSSPTGPGTPNNSNPAAQNTANTSDAASLRTDDLRTQPRTKHPSAIQSNGHTWAIITPIVRHATMPRLIGIKVAPTQNTTNPPANPSRRQPSESGSTMRRMPRTTSTSGQNCHQDAPRTNSDASTLTPRVSSNDPIRSAVLT